MLFCHIKISRFRFGKTEVMEVPYASTYVEEARKIDFECSKEILYVLFWNNLLLFRDQKKKYRKVLQFSFPFFPDTNGMLRFFKITRMNCFFVFPRKKKNVYFVNYFNKTLNCMHISIYWKLYKIKYKNLRKINNQILRRYERMNIFS